MAWTVRCVSGAPSKSATTRTSSNGNIFHPTDPLWGESTGHRWISPHKDQWHEALVFSLICTWTNGPEQTVEQTMEAPVIWDTIALILTYLQWFGIFGCYCEVYTTSKSRRVSLSLSIPLWSITWSHLLHTEDHKMYWAINSWDIFLHVWLSSETNSHIW